MEDGSIRIAKAADAAAIAIIHVESWRETYTGIVPDHVLAGLSEDQRTVRWHRILCDPTTFYSSVVLVAERKGAIFGFSCCGMQRTETLRAQGYDGEVSSIYILRSSQRQGFGSALMGAMARELRRRQLHAASLWVLRENASARGFYERIGGEIVGEKEDIGRRGVFIEVAYEWRNLAELVERTASH